VSTIEYIYLIYLTTLHSFRPLSKKLNSAQFFTVALLLFFATGVQAYYSNTTTAPTASPYYNEKTDALFTITRQLVLTVRESLSPLMILACTVAMAGTLCRGLELVIQAAAFKGK
jgi:hypothetical protein